jgi:hypothetical protein
MIILKNRNYRLSFDWYWKELGLGCIIHKPVYKSFPRQNFWIGITIRLVWFGIFIKMLERKPDTTTLEIYEKKERMKEIVAFHYKELIVCKNNNSLDVSWQWNRLGIMIYYRSTKGSIPGSISLDLLWFSILYDIR